MGHSPDGSRDRARVTPLFSFLEFVIAMRLGLSLSRRRRSSARWTTPCSLRGAAKPGTRPDVNKGRESLEADAEAAPRYEPTYAGLGGPVWPGISSRRAICCIFFWRALIRPFVKRCFAAMQRILSSNTNFADNNGAARPAVRVRWPWIVICKQRESSLSPLTSISCRKPTSLATPHPRRFVSGSTRINCRMSITRNRRSFMPSFIDSVHAMRSELSTNEETQISTVYAQWNHSVTAASLGISTNRYSVRLWLDWKETRAMRRRRRGVHRQRAILRSSAWSICTQTCGFVSGSCVSTSPFSCRTRSRTRKNTRIARFARSTCNQKHASMKYKHF